MAYTYRPTASILNLISQIEVSSALILNLPTSPTRQLNLRRVSTLKSSVFSARIEGNPLMPSDINFSSISPQNKHKLEVQNILTALNFIFSARCPRRLSITLIQKLHFYILKNIGNSPGQFRTEQTGIFNQAGVAIYLTPPPTEIKSRLQELIAYTNTSPDHYIVKSALIHYWFEKIHPFEDGNGRVGRLISQFLLDHRARRFHGLLAFEEQIDQFRSEYYSLLTSSSFHLRKSAGANATDITEFIEFYLECVKLAAESTVDQLKQPESGGVEATLLPRRRELLATIRDHHLMSFDQLHRRFLAVNQSTLRYDLNQLIKAGLVTKLGSTRGALYQPK